MSILLADVDAAQSYFAKRGDKPWVQQRGFSLICVRPAGTESVDLLWDAPNHLVWAMVGLPCTPAPEHRAMTAAAICEVNAALPINGFQLRRGVAWKTHLFLDEQGSVEAESLLRLVDLSAAAVTKYRPYILAAAGGTPLSELPPRTDGPPPSGGNQSSE